MDEAAACCRRAVALRPDFAEANNNLGNALREMGKVDEAVDCYRQALALKPNDAEVHGNLGSALEETGDLQGAEESFRAALEHDPRCASHISNWRNFWAAIFRRVIWLRSVDCWSRLLPPASNGSWRTRNDSCCTSAWRKSWTRGASMPRPPNTSNAPTPCKCPIGAIVAERTTLKSTSRSSAR